MFKMIAFDFDGTIADSFSMCMEAFRSSISPYIDHELDDQEITNTFGLNEMGTIKAIVKNNWEQALSDFDAKYETLHETLTEPFEGIRELISVLKENNVKVSLITGKGEKTCSISLKKMNMENVFNDVLCGTEYGPNKHKCMATLLNKYKLSKSEFAYIADSLKDIEACKLAGVTCLSAAWQENANVDMLEKENPHLVFSSVENLRMYLKNNI